MTYERILVYWAVDSVDKSPFRCGQLVDKPWTTELPTSYPQPAHNSINRRLTHPAHSLDEYGFFSTHINQYLFIKKSRLFCLDN
jgi:hypothetical protein